MCFDEAKEALKKILFDAISIRLRSDVKVGSCLSGGLDSSAIVCIVNKLLAGQGKAEKQETVSACFKEEGCNEERYVDTVANSVGITAHKVFPAFEDVLARLDKVAWHQDVPFYSTSIFAQWQVFEEAKKNGIAVMLDGQGADESLAGYDIFDSALIAELFLSFRWKSLARVLNQQWAKNNGRRANDLKRVLFLLIQSKAYVFLLKRYKAIARFVPKPAWRRPWFDFRGRERGLDGEYQIIKTNIRNESLNQIVSTSLPMLLHFEDRNSMAHSVESRHPFIDFRMIELVLGLPSEFKLKDGRKKLVLREAVRGLVPGDILDRVDKMAFTTPEELWIRAHAPVVRKEIEEACDRLGTFVNRDNVLASFDYLMTSGEQFAHRFWPLISVGRWMKVFQMGANR